MKRRVLILALSVCAATVTTGAAAQSTRRVLAFFAEQERAPQASVERLVGQTIMTGFSGTTPDAGLLARIRAGQVGGVILFGSNITSPSALRHLVDRLQSAATSGNNLPLLIAVDQEGGEVKRLPDGPPALSPAAMGDEDSTTATRLQGRQTCTYLRQYGVNVDLAPVLDTPDSASNFLGDRAFSERSGRNARLGRAFVSGLQSCGIAATAKHFPGLGTASEDTDSNHVLIATAAMDLDSRLAPFKAAARGGVKLVMVSNAGYLAYDASRVPAVLSKRIIMGLLRNQLKFRGVVISDSMEAPGPASRPDAATRAMRAGVDMLLYTQERDSATAYDELVTAAADGQLPPATIREAASRVERLKRWLHDHSHA